MSLVGSASGSSIFSAAYEGAFGTVRTLLDESLTLVAAKDEANWTPLMIAASVGCAPIVDLLLGRGADPDLGNENLQTPLFYAATKGSKVNAKDQLRQTPLHRAAAKGNTAVLKLLLAAPKVEVDAEDRSGNTPLHLAVDMGNGEAALALIQAGADVTILNKEEQTPLDMGRDKNVREFLVRAVAGLGR
ncbi:hypothetical protein HDU67_000803 [Dinochytrium kinnereticum]|nr:hypothetical protein HDU67_000803 [Dinochytrium kinnereticum]